MIQLTDPYLNLFRFRSPQLGASGEWFTLQEKPTDFSHQLGSLENHRVKKNPLLPGYVGSREGTFFLHVFAV